MFIYIHYIFSTIYYIFPYRKQDNHKVNFITCEIRSSVLFFYLFQIIYLKFYFFINLAISKWQRFFYKILVRSDGHIRVYS